ncbi:MAG: peptidoglycan recognition family protein [Actinomycetota bacterium]
MIFDMAVLHYTLSDDVPAYIVDEWHEAREFIPRGTNVLKYIGYHYLVRAFGMVEPGRSLDAQPTHCPGYNRAGVLAICFCGSTPDETPWYPTDFQYKSGAGLLVQHNIPKDRIFGHGQLYDTSCPGRLDIPRIIRMMESAQAPYVLPIKEDEMPRFEIVRSYDQVNEKTGEVTTWRVYGCGRVNHNHRLDILAEAPGGAYTCYAYRVPIGKAPANQAETIKVGGWDNEDNRGASFYLHQVFGECGEFRMTIHSPVPLAIEVGV